MTGQRTGIRGIKKLMLAGATLFMALLCLVLISSTALAFTAKTIGDYGNVTVMEVTGSYDSHNPDGSINADPRKTIAKEFYRLHKDEYDFLVIFSNFSFRMPDTHADAFYLHVKNDTRGIGQQIIAMFIYLERRIYRMSLKVLVSEKSAG